MKQELIWNRDIFHKSYKHPQEGDLFEICINRPASKDQTESSLSVAGSLNFRQAKILYAHLEDFIREHDEYGGEDF